MNQPTPLSLRLELDSVADPIFGRLLRAGHAPVAFRGWVGLAAALDRLTAPDADPDAQDDLDPA